MLPRLLNHIIWSDERTAQSLASLPAPDAELTKLYAHILGAEATWLARINGESPIGAWPEFDAAACAALAARNHLAFRVLISTMTPDSLARPIAYSRSDGPSFTNTVEEILHQLVLHGMYHRGQVARGVRQGGGTPLPTDFIVFARGGG